MILKQKELMLLQISLPVQTEKKSEVEAMIKLFV
jgi:hypothetical protein